MTIDPRTPCIIGVAQRTWRLSGDDLAPEPLEMEAEVVRAAASDAGATGDLLGAVDSLDVTYSMSWPYDDPSGRLAAKVGISPARAEYSGIGGTVPQQLLAAAAERILAGRSEVAVIAGAEALDTKRRLKKAGERPSWSHRAPETPPFPFEAPFHPAEVAHEVFQAWLTFALRDVARRASIGTSPDDHRRSLGELLAPMTEIAAANPNSWFPTVHSAEELITATADNRMVGYPYTKTMVAVMDVDMAAAVIVASWGAADRLGVPLDRRVAVRGWAYATDPIYVAEHPDLGRSPAMAAATHAALGSAGVGADDVACFDLYSCFASSIDFARDALGISVGDSRALTVTGGLPYAGGPGSNYGSHALTSMVQRLREDPGALGLTTGVGMHMTKHAATVLSTDPGPSGSTPDIVDGAALQAGVDASNEPRSITDTFEGGATVAAYSVVHGRDGSPEWGLAICDLPDGTRSYGRVEELDLLVDWESSEWVGATVRSTVDGAVNRLTA